MLNREISDERLQLDALDGLRGLAALIVILSHTSNASMFFIPYIDARGIGKSGVFLFFLLSSFLLSRALIKQGASAFSRSSISHYMQRRFFRIYPLYIPYLFIGLVSTFAITLFFEKEGLGIPFSLTILEFFKHLILIEGKGVTWSIAVEFKFYFILPIIILILLTIKNRMGFLAEIIFLLLLIALTQVVSPQGESLVNDPRLMPYMCIFLLGIILAVVQCEIESGRLKKSLFTPIIPLSYLSVLALIFMTPSGISLIIDKVENNYFHKDFIQHSILWGIVILSVINFNSRLSLFFKMNWLVFYGSLSFSIYLFHPIFIKIAYRLPLNEYLSAWFVLLLSTITSYTAYRFLELPVSKFKFTYKEPSNPETR